MTLMDYVLLMLGIGLVLVIKSNAREDELKRRIEAARRNYV